MENYKNKAKNMNRPLYSISGIQDPEWQWNEYKERERIIKMLNKGDIVRPESNKCETGEHYILINEFGQVQCAELSCLKLFDWSAVLKELGKTNWTKEQKKERYAELKKVAHLVDVGTPPGNIVNCDDYVYLHGTGFRYIQRYFYDRD